MGKIQTMGNKQPRQGIADAVFLFQVGDWAIIESKSMQAYWKGDDYMPYLLHIPCNSHAAEGYYGELYPFYNINLNKECAYCRVAPSEKVIDKFQTVGIFVGWMRYENQTQAKANNP